MRTTLNIPDDLLATAKELTRFTSKTDIVVLALQELIRRKRIEELKALAGTVPDARDVRALEKRRARR
jgi:Arc/MetJ family transcription regulator